MPKAPQEPGPVPYFQEGNIPSKSSDGVISVGNAVAPTDSPSTSAAAWQPPWDYSPKHWPGVCWRPGQQRHKRRKRGHNDFSQQYVMPSVWIGKAQFPRTMHRALPSSKGCSSPLTQFVGYGPWPSGRNIHTFLYPRSGSRSCKQNDSRPVRGQAAFRAVPPGQWTCAWCCVLMV